MPQFDPVKLESFVKIRAPQIAKDIQAVAAKAINEADLVAETEKILDKFATNFDIQLDLRREQTLINGRADAIYNRFVIEYEPPRSLTKSNIHHNNKHAIEQVQNYMGGLERLDRQKKERLAGVAMDGSYFIFVRYRDDHWHIDDPLPINNHSTEIFLRYLLALSTELALTPDNLVRDFGENSNVARRVVPSLYKAISTTDSKKANVLFRQWLHQFREVSGYDPEGSQLNAKELGKLYAVNEKNIDLEKLFFSIHTYYATFIKLLALQVAYYYLMPKMGSGLRGAANGTDEQLCKFLQNMERGGLFAELGIKNFLEGDFFGWYLDIWDENLFAAFQRLIGDLANYSLVTLDVDPEETRDLLKQLYQNLVPKELRHALGEYYTPDWLAERLLNQLGYQGDPKIRILDPACGSGTFLVLAIKRVHAYADEKMLPPAQVLDQVLQNVVGFDLNPLAVISSRTNYLLALGDLLQHRNGDITIPVYLADSILTPTQGTELFTHKSYSFSTAVGRFSVPTELVQQSNYISQLADLLEECVHVNLDSTLFEQRLINTFGLKRPEDDGSISIAIGLYNRLIELEKQGINGIWARIIKNAFAPLFQPKFDLIAGNPPWVNWESLPKEYREETIPLWMEHGLFNFKGYEAMLGKSKDDISILMTYVAIDKYLNNNGKLGFIITQSIFKSGAGSGFRNFKLGNGIPIKVTVVDDLSSLKPFEGASNRTSMFIAIKGESTTYPLPYSYWYKPKGGSVISESLSLEDIIKEKIAQYYNFYARPIDVNEPTSPWLTGRKRELDIAQKTFGSSFYQGRKGITASINGVFWIDMIKENDDGTFVITNYTKRSRKAIEQVQACIESDLVYPLLRGLDVRRWSANPSMKIIVTHKPESGLKAISVKEMALKYPKTYQYLKLFEPKLRASGIYRRFFNQDDPFYSVFNIGEYTFAPYKIVFREISTDFTCAVVDTLDNKVIIPDHKLVLCPFSDRLEAHYVCGILNSSIVRFVAGAYSIETQFSTHIFDYINIPKFDFMDINHLELAKLSEQAHELVKEDKKEEIKIIEENIDTLAAKIWELTDEELMDIQEGLKEG